MKYLVISVPFLFMLIHESVSMRKCKPNINCPPGLKVENRECVEVNECEEDPCTGMHTDCIDKPGGYDCNCTQGYEFSEGSDMCKLKSCDEGWERYGTSCYKQVTEPYLVWADAEAACVSEGGHLLSIETLQERDWIDGEIRDIMDAINTGRPRYWVVGLYRDPNVWTGEAFGLWMTAQVEPSLVWMDGEQYTGLPQRIEPTQSLDAGPKEMNHTCVAVINGEFFLWPCHSTQLNNHTCQKAKGASCDADWLEVGSKCLYYDDIARTLTDAQSFCQQNGGQLAKIQTQAELDAMQTNGYDGVIGLKSTLKSFDPIIARIGEVYSHWTDGTPYTPDLLQWSTISTSADEDYMIKYKSSMVDGEWIAGYMVAEDSENLSYWCKKRL